MTIEQLRAETKLAVWEVLEDRDAARTVCVAIDAVFADAAAAPVAAPDEVSGPVRPEPTDDVRAVAERIVGAGLIDADAEMVSAGLTMVKGGTSRRAVARKFGVSHSTAARWVALAQRECLDV